MYLGVNVGQKVGLAFADKLMPKEESNIEEGVNEKWKWIKLLESMLAVYIKSARKIPPFRMVIWIAVK